MASAEVSLKDLDKFIKKGMTIITKKVSVPVSEILETQRQEIEAKAKDNSLSGVYTGKLFYKIRTNTYKESRQGKLSGTFINPKEMKLFISKPSDKDKLVLRNLQFGTEPHYIEIDDRVREWLNLKPLNNPKLRNRKDGNMLPVAHGANSAYRGGGKSPMTKAKIKIMLDIERQLKINFK